MLIVDCVSILSIVVSVIALLVTLENAVRLEGKSFDLGLVGTTW